MKVGNNINAGLLNNAAEILTGFVSLPAADPEPAVPVAGIDMYAENLDDYGESLNANAAEFIAGKKSIK